MEKNNIFWRKHWSMIFAVPALVMFIYQALWYAWNGLLLLIAIGQSSLVVVLILILTGIPLALIFAPAGFSFTAPFAIAEWHQLNIDKNVWERSIKVILMFIGSFIGIHLWWLFILFAVGALMSSV